VKDANGKLLVDNDQVKEEWRKYKEKLVNEENTWDNATLEGPCELIRTDESLKALRMTKKGKAADPTGIVSEMFMADEGCSVEWLTSLCNLIVAHGRIPDDWKISILLPVFNGKVSNASQSFICRCCKVDRPITDGLNTDLHLDIGNGVSLEKVDKFWGILLFMICWMQVEDVIQQ